ncbi:ATP-grasp domain-containing protein [Pseudomonas sp. R3-52-08]|uniref:ATP-grasp domain-containing protein n=1 Tax=Pseudomonas sp. R3-52-08 TaxID=1173284 RepID=UPI000F56CD18|nr:ATP-grasp domain-containing protein [Pseudomonas sp. R3-52-08]AZF21178.1 hypothetical protein C4J91_2428 [Pseudomonas sp. R3-52-08]
MDAEVGVKSKLVVYGNTPRLIDTAKLLGHEIIQFVLPEDALNFTWAPQVTTIITDYTLSDDHLSILQALRLNTEFSGVVSLAEFGLLPAAKAAELFKLRGATVEAVKLSRDKYLMREYLQSQMEEVIGFAKVQGSNELIEFGKKYGYPFILKPISGVASEGVHIIEEVDDLCEVCFNGREYLAEQWIDGMELSVDCFGSGGELYCLGVNEEVKRNSPHGNKLVEMQHVFPARIKEVVRLRTIKRCKEILMKLGLNDGPSHTEFKVKGEEIALIETHSRFGGDYIYELYERTTGVNPIREYLKWAVGNTVRFKEEFTGSASIHFLEAIPGVITDIIGLEYFRSHKNVARIEMPLTVGSTVKTIEESPDRIGYVVVTGSSNSESAEIASHVASSISIVTV